LAKGRETGPDGSPAGRVLILTAAVGSGHVVAGGALGEELGRAGWEVELRDGLEIMSPVPAERLGGMYVGQVRHLPRPLALLLWTISFRGTADLVRVSVGALFGGRLLEVVRTTSPDLIVSTYPLVTAALGHLRRRGRITVPVAALVTDYGVHPMWVSPALDVHLVASEVSAGMVERAGGKATVVRMPLREGFRRPLSREEARRTLGLPLRVPVALVVGGAWGIGDLAGCVRTVAGTRACHVVAVTGRNEVLRRRLQHEYAGKDDVRIVGWTEEMPLLMSAADFLVQNAGGVTCLEAAALGLPVLLYRPIPGHGAINARAMERAGVALWARSAGELEAIIRGRAFERAVHPPSVERLPAAPDVLSALRANWRRW